MRSILFSLILLSSFLITSAQESYYDANDKITEDSVNLQLSKKTIGYSFSAGTIFSSSDGYSNYFGSYILPQVSYKLTPELSIKTGVLFMKNNNLGIISNENYLKSNNINSLFYLGGDYLLNDHVTLHGSMLIDLNPDSQIKYDSWMFGMDYKVGKNSYIGIEFQYNKSNQHPFYRNSQNPISSNNLNFNY
ncbi:MAG: hypothetical protein ABIJ97_17415 [Bacteroidota bacterium]